MNTYYSLRKKLTTLLTLQSLFFPSYLHTENLHVLVGMDCILCHRMPSIDEIPRTFAAHINTTYVSMLLGLACTINSNVHKVNKNNILFSGSDLISMIYKCHQNTQSC